MPIITEDPLKVAKRYDPTKLDFGSVKGEVSDAMQYDWKRDKVDDAKKRAITDARSYDDFKSRVAGCTLKPIHRNEFNAPPKYAFNRQVEGASAGKPHMPAGAAVPLDPCRGQALQAAPATGLRNSREFEREFKRRSTAEDRVALLAELDGDLCAKLFAKELDAEVLRQALEALDEVGTTSGTSGAARGLLRALVNRCPGPVAMSATFLTSPDRRLVARILAREEASEPGEDVRICSTFGVPSAMLAAAVAEADESAREGAEAAAAVGGAAAELAAADSASPPAEPEPASAPADEPAVAEASGFCDGMD